jgi:predicted double-glycine peptidase
MSKDKSGNWVKRHKILTGILVLFIIIVCTTSSSSKSKSTASNTATKTSSATATKSAAPTASMPKLNQPADDGQFEFTVTSFSCGQSSVTDPDSSYLVANAKGQFCLMALNIKNIGKQSQTFDDSSQYIYNSGNTQYTSDSEATSTLEGSSGQIGSYPSLNPGVSISGTVVFDVPAGVTIDHALLHDSSLSNGVKVNLQ